MPANSTDGMAETLAIVPVARRRLWSRDPARPAPVPALDEDEIVPPAIVSERKRISRADIALVAGGISLGLISAFFPWYVFFNQEQFGIRAVVFENDASPGSAPSGAPPAGRIADPIASGLTPPPALDTMSTGTLQQDDEGATPPPGVAEQPFPQPIQEFHVVHIANGRAMLQDDSGLWLVQRGSELPDKTRVTAIEQRGDRWVLVTSGDRVIGIGE